MQRGRLSRVKLEPGTQVRAMYDRDGKFYDGIIAKHFGASLRTRLTGKARMARTVSSNRRMFLSR